MSRGRWFPGDWEDTADAPAWYPPAAPKQPPPPEGIKVRKIGATWWGRRWIGALEQISPEYGRRIARGRTYARAGRVHALTVRRGRVTARVTGSRAEPYAVSIAVRPLSRTAWTRALTGIAREARFAAQLLTGAMPEDAQDVFLAAGASLFPTTREDLETACSCPDWANPCKHVAAAHVVLGDAIDRDPFLLLELRGRSRTQVLDALRRLRARAGPAPSRTTRPRSVLDQDERAIPAVLLDAACRARFEQPQASLAGLRFHITAPPRHAAVLRQLGPPPSWSLRESPEELLGAAYEAAGVWARRVATARAGEMPNT